MVTRRIEVGNLTFMFERLAADCDPLQYLRELTQNAIEATRKVGPTHQGVAVWDYDSEIFEKTGVKKLCLIDNGVGMSGEEMVRYINHLSSSSGVQNVSSNFGVGAKISAGVNNPEGMVYMSWKNGIGYQIHFWRDPVTGEYGLKPLRNSDGAEAFWIKIDDSHKPNIIHRHGTKVTLLGKSPEDDTTEGPAGVVARSKWIRRVLNARYFQLPDNFRLLVNEGWSQGGDRSGKGRFPVSGQGKFLNGHSSDQGCVHLEGAKAHWWILKEDQKANEVESGGHLAAVYQNELYEMKAGHSARSQLQQFGVVLGTQRVVIYVEPDPKHAECITDTARSRLKYNGKDLPWLTWATEFESNMPDALRKYISNLLSRDRDNTDYRHSIKQRLQDLSDLYDFSRYIPAENGKDRISPVNATDKTRKNDRSELGKTRNGKDTSGSSDKRSASEASDLQGSKGTTSAHFKDASGDQQGRPKKEIILPRVVWLSAEKGNRIGTHLEDRAAEAPTPTTLFINEDFRGYRDLLRVHLKKWESVPGAGDTVAATVKEWYEQNLVEAVIACQALGETSPNPMPLSEENLTFASLPRSIMTGNINRVLAAKLGKASVHFRVDAEAMTPTVPKPNGRGVAPVTVPA